MTVNERQQTAIKHEHGPLLIVAGAGTGKTTVITERVKYLIQEKKVNPYHILAATFTEKAAEEMRARLDVVMPFGYKEPWLGTFHGLCERILQLEGLEIGLNPNFKILTQTDQWIFLRQHLYEFDLKYYRPVGNPTRFVSALIKYFSRLADENILPSSMTEFAQSNHKGPQTTDEKLEADRIAELAKAYETYAQLKADHAVLDFGDLITQTLRLFQIRPNVCKRYRSQFEHILVDEFQDTNYAQFELIKLLAPPEENPDLIVVGDDDQSVYKFRGASVSNILEFKTVYSKAKEVVLTDNYRSTQEILDSAYQSIVANNPDRLEAKLNIDKKLTAHRELEVKPEVLQFATVEDEVAWTILQIVELVAKYNLIYKDIAIIARANSQLEAYVAALKSTGIPYQLVANHGLFDQDEVKSLLVALQVIADPTDAIAVFQLSQSHVFHIDPAMILQLIQISKEKATTLWQELKNVDNGQAKHMLKVINELQDQTGTKTVTQLLYQFIDNTNYMKAFTSVESVENQLKVKNINLFINRLRHFETSSSDRSIVGFLETLELWYEAGENPGQAQIEDIDTVSLMTIHAAKGLEFDAVFVGGLVAGRFPSNSRSDLIEVPEELIKETLPQGDEHLEEERRLFYVALTRAKRFLYLTFSEDTGGVRKRKMSGFINETGLPVRAVTIDPVNVPTKSNATPVKPQYLEESGKFVIDMISYTQIDTFNTCPLKYKYKYLLQIPSKPHHSLSFGQTIHQTLYEYHLNEQQGKKLDLDGLLALYKKNFVEDGYENPKHKEERFASGEAALKDYYERYETALGKPVLLEQTFRVNLGDVVLTGKIDRIDETADGTFELIDYKTGEQKHRDKKVADKDEQLTIYALAAKEALNLPVSQMGFYFLENGGTKLMTTRTEADLVKERERLLKQIDAIKNSDFPGKPDPVKCGYCEYASLCPFVSKKKL